MKLEDIAFEDDAFKAAVLATRAETAEEVVSLKARKQSIKSVKGIECLTNLKFLDLTRNQISEIDLSNNIHLSELFIGNNQLEELDVSMLPDLEVLEVFMNDIVELDLSHNPKLEIVCANANDFNALDLSKNSGLVELRLSDNSLKQLTLAEGLSLETFCAENNLFSDDQKAAFKEALADCSVKV